MIKQKIQKLYEFECSHRVIGAWSERCSKNIHGHSYKIEIELTSKKLTDYNMVIDFGEINKFFKPQIDKFDHCCHFINTDSLEYKTFIKNNNSRWVESAFNPTAEGYSKFFLILFNNIILKEKLYKNNELFVNKVRVWETRTGSATSEFNNYKDMINYISNINNADNNTYYDIKYSSECNINI